MNTNFKNIFNKILIIFLFIVYFSRPVYADVVDTADIFTAEDETLLNDAISKFESNTGFKVYIEVIEKNDEYISFENFASSRYLEVFPEGDGFYYLISKEDGDILIKYSDFDEVVTQELISVMMMSMNTNFEQGEIASGLIDSLNNGAVLINENRREIQEREDNHTVLEENPNKWMDYRVFICIACVIIFIVNIIILINPNKRHKEG